MNDFLSKAKGVVLGHATGDALGVPFEFCPREYLDGHPVTGMAGYGAHRMPEGAWSDDTSMSLCALKSFAHGRLDYVDIMLNFVKWYARGEFTPTGKTFDVGRTCHDAIIRGGGLDGEFNNGNGSLMRIYPFTLYLINKNCEKMSLQHVKTIATASSLTHAHARSRVACILYSFILWELMENPCKQSVNVGIRNFEEMYKHFNGEEKAREEEVVEIASFKAIFDGIDKLDRSQIKSTGYVVDTLEAALWCLLTTDSYEECVLKAVNLGHDADTTGAVVGALAGALYGYDAIPEEWLKTLIKRDYIEGLCEEAFIGVRRKYD